MVGIAILALLVILYVAGKAWTTREIERRIGDRARERGLTISWQASTWNPWSGLKMERVTVKESGTGGKQVAELDNISAHFPLGQFIGMGGRRIEWRMNDAKVVLHDAQGPITMEGVSFFAESRPGEVRVVRAAARHGGAVAKASGKIITAAVPQRRKDPFVLKLRALRGTLAVLDVEQGGDFLITVTFQVDISRRPDISWSTDLQGTGTNLVWKGVPLESVKAGGTLGSANSALQVDGTASNGAIGVSITRQTWKTSPLLFRGTLKDSHGLEDSFHGDYQRPVLTIESLTGPADLLMIARGIPRAAAKVPGPLVTRTFPTLEASGIRVRTGPEPRTWSIDSVKVEGGELVWRYEDKDVMFSHLSGSASHDGSGWQLEDAKAAVLGGTVEVSGRYQDKVLKNGRVESAGIRVGDLRRLVDQEEGKAGKGIIHLDYRGDVNIAEKTLDGGGTVKLENAPTFDVPLLEEVYELFRTIVPGMERPAGGKFDAEFTARDRKISVSRFEASGGTLNVNAKGVIDLQAKRVDGRARGKLTGLPGVVTSPLSRLLEMEVSGPYEDIHVKPLGPARLASAAASGTVDDVVDFVEEKGKVTGTVIKESIKAPFKFLRNRGEESTKDVDKPRPGDSGSSSPGPR